MKEDKALYHAISGFVPPSHDSVRSRYEGYRRFLGRTALRALIALAPRISWGGRSAECVRRFVCQKLRSSTVAAFPSAPRSFTIR